MTSNEIRQSFLAFFEQQGHRVVPSSPLVPALLPLAQAKGVGGADVLPAYCAGFEVGVTLGRALNPKLYAAGWHATSTSILKFESYQAALSSL